MNDKGWDSHEVYQIDQKNQCGSKGICSLSCLKLATIIVFVSFWGMGSSEALTTTYFGIF